MKEHCNVYYCTKKKEEMPQSIAKKLLTHGFLESFGIPYNEEEIQRTEYGKPFIDRAGMYFNLSHGQELVAVACARIPVGIDVESPRRVLENTIQRCCSNEEYHWLEGSKQREKDFLKLWTLKESYVKMTGEGFRISPDTVGFSLRKDGKADCNREGTFFQYELEEGILSLGIWKEGWKGKINIQKLVFEHGKSHWYVIE